MERKNTVLLTVIAVATLLVAVVGATFAYFTATNNASGSAAEDATVNTAKVADISFAKETITGTENVIYPGTMNAVGAGFTSKVDSEDDDSEYTITYEVKGKVSLLNNLDTETEFDFPVKWRLYEVSDKIESGLVTCSKVDTVTVGNEVRYTQSCDENAKFVDSGDLGTKTLVASGKIEKETGDACTPQTQPAEGQIACGKSADITFESSIDISKTQTSKYYYLVVEYPTVDSEDQNQNADMGKKIKLEISDITVKNTAAKTE